MRWLLRCMEWVAVAGAVVVVLVLLVAVMQVFLASARFGRKVAALRAAGDPVMLADLAPEKIAVQSNAATYLRRARSDVEAIQAQMLTVDGEMDKVGFYEGGTSPSIEAAIRETLVAHPDAIPLLRQAANCPDYDPQLDFNVDRQTFTKDLLDHLQYSRAAMRILNFQARLQLAESHAEEALNTCIAMFRLARHFDRNPTIVSQLVAIAMRGITVATANLILRAGPLDDSAHRNLEAELARYDVAEAYRQGLRSERAFGLRAFQDTARKMGVGARWFPSFNNDQCDYLNVMAEYIQGAEGSYADSPTIDRSKLGTLTQGMIPSLQAQHQSFARIRAELRSLRVLNALVEHEHATAPSTVKVEELGLPEDAIADPFNGEPLCIKRLPTGWLVYSVGANLKDDGGKLVDNEDVGLGPVEPVTIKNDGDNNGNAPQP